MRQLNYVDHNYSKSDIYRYIFLILTTLSKGHATTKKTANGYVILRQVITASVSISFSHYNKIICLNSLYDKQAIV